jgi:hypothetical protein
MSDPRPPDERVQSALRGIVEVNLARERAIARALPELHVAFHSNGVIFSKSGNGTPFSNGIIFSKTGRAEIGDVGAATLEEQTQLVQGLIELDETAFSEFTNRLLQIRQAKVATQITQITEPGP